MNHKVVLLYSENPARGPRPGEVGDLLDIRFEKDSDGNLMRRHLDVRWDSGLVESLVEGQDSWTVFTEDEDEQTFGTVAFGEPTPLRLRGGLSESDMSRLQRSAIQAYQKETFSEADSGLEISLALLWQFYILLYKGAGTYNAALVAEFLRRSEEGVINGSVGKQDSPFDFTGLTIRELIRRSMRAAHNLQKYNLPELVGLSFEESQRNYTWKDAAELTRDEAAELLFVALSEYEDQLGARIEIFDIKRILINCLELMKVRGKAIYKYACYRSQEEYDTIAEEDAEIFGCVAHSEEEADEIVGAKNFWLSVLIGVQAIEDQSPE